MLGALGGTGVGAATGSLAADIINRERGADIPLAPSLARAAVSGLENMAFDAAGNVVFHYGGKLIKLAADSSEIPRLLIRPNLLFRIFWSRVEERLVSSKSIQEVR